MQVHLLLPTIPAQSGTPGRHGSLRLTSLDTSGRYVYQSPYDIEWSVDPMTGGVTFAQYWWPTDRAAVDTWAYISSLNEMLQIEPGGVSGLLYAPGEDWVTENGLLAGQTYRGYRLKPRIMELPCVMSPADDRLAWYRQHGTPAADSSPVVQRLRNQPTLTDLRRVLQPRRTSGYLAISAGGPYAWQVIPVRLTEVDIPLDRDPSSHPALPVGLELVADSPYWRTASSTGSFWSPVTTDQPYNVYASAPDSGPSYPMLELTYGSDSGLAVPYPAHISVRRFSDDAELYSVMLPALTTPAGYRVYVRLDPAQGIRAWRRSVTTGAEQDITTQLVINGRLTSLAEGQQRVTLGASHSPNWSVSAWAEVITEAPAL